MTSISLLVAAGLLLYGFLRVGYKAPDTSSADLAVESIAVMAYAVLWPLFAMVLIGATFRMIERRRLGLR